MILTDGVSPILIVVHSADGLLDIPRIVVIGKQSGASRFYHLLWSVRRQEDEQRARVLWSKPSLGSVHPGLGLTGLLTSSVATDQGASRCRHLHQVGAVVRLICVNTYVVEQMPDGVQHLDGRTAVVVHGLSSP